MCGICGFIQTQDQGLDTRSVLQAMCRTIQHRGPDDEGHYFQDNAALGARRLSIIDVAGGHQPISNEDGTVGIAHNGEVYNFPQLREELLAAGHVFKSRTDTETVLHSYEEWGLEFANKLRGMFVSAIWDSRRKRLVVVRDRLGIKPLYYTQLSDRSFVFGSELKAILAHPQVQTQMEPRALDFFLTLEYIPAPYSIFKNIFKLPAGHTLVFESGKVQVDRYWNLPTPPAFGKKTTVLDIPELKDELFSLLKESVELRMISDVPLGAFLSGGIDSSCIVGLMRELGASPLKTFSIGFEDQTYNELEHARRIARRFETEHEEFIIQPKALELTETLIRHLDEPFGDFSIFPTYLVSKMAREHVTVILSGDGGDELFGGYEHYQAQKLAQKAWLAPVHAALGSVVSRFPPSGKKKGLWNKLQRYSQGFELDPSLRHFRWMMFLTPQQKDALYSPSLAAELGGMKLLNQQAPFQQFFENMAHYDDVSAELYLDLNTYLIDNILVKVDRMSMATSLETRVPLIDHKVVEFMFNLPGELKLRGMTTKWLFKESMERLLPKENITRKKEGFSIPIKHWLRGELKDLMLSTLEKNRITQAGYFHFPEIQRMINAHLQGKANYSHQLWALLVFEIWRENYLS
jgi:asparagine synthase (glutamine-hydrolysing)